MLATQTRGLADADRLWRTLYGPQCGYIGLFSGLRPVPGERRLTSRRTAFFEYPRRLGAASGWCAGQSAGGREAYFCAHLLTRRRRTKAHAAPVLALWAEADDVAEPVPPGAPEPTAVVESSPGRYHLFWRLMRPVSPLAAEDLNRRLCSAVGADRSGWDLSQLLRPPGTKNLKYEDAPLVALVAHDPGVVYHPRELDLALPASASPAPPSAPAAPTPPASDSGPAAGVARAGVDLSRLSGRMRAIIAHGNRGASNPYNSRSEADFAVAIAMFGAGYDEREVWAVMTDPANGISERYFEKGRHGHGYLDLTIRNAGAVALPYPIRRGRPSGAGAKA